MALFQRRPQISEAKQFYTIGLNKTLLIVGLGNPGAEYAQSRHNIGFEVIDAFAKTNDFPNWTLKKELRAELTKTTINDVPTILIKPSTFMNLSGQAVQATASFYKIPPSQITVIHDELDIHFGTIRTRVGGASAGHNGVKSIIEQLGEDFGRIRIGIGPKQPADTDSADFVLKKFSKAELGHLPALLRETNAILSEFIFSNGTLSNDTRDFLL